jgi:tripartite-type tricarboxylate transporter receptor subunit TctC
VHPSVKANSVAELIALAKANPGKLNFASGASFAQLLGEAFKHRAGVDIVHVRYKGIQPAITEFLAGRVELIFADLPSILPQHKAGKARILGVTGAHRSGIAPEIPTIAERGLAGYDFPTWYAYVAPAATPRAVIEKLNAAIVRALENGEIRKRLLALGLDVRPSKPEYVDQLVRSEIDKWGKIVKEAGIAPQ